MKSKMTMPVLSRRKFLVLTGQGAAAVALASCAGAAPAAPAATNAPVPAAPAKVSGKVEFLAWGDTGDIASWETLQKTYLQKNPDVQLTVTPITDPGNNFYPKLQTSIAGGTPPQVASFQGWEWQVYADKGVLAPIDDLIKRDKAEAAYPDLKSMNDITIRKGKRYMVPMQLATMLMYYAKKPFLEAGVPFPTDDWTYDQFIDIARKLTNPAKKMWGIQPNNNWYRDIHWIRATGKTEFDSIMDPKKAQFNQPEIAAVLQQVVVDWAYKDKIAPTSADMTGGANQIQTGNTAMRYDGPWFFPSMNSQKLRDDKKNVEFDVVLMPKQADGSRPHRGWAEGIAVLKTNNIEGGWSLANYFSGEEGQKIYATNTGRIPSIQKLVNDWWIPTVADAGFGVKNGKAFIEANKNTQLDVVSGVPRSKMWAEVVKPTAYDPMVAGTKKASEVLADVDAKLNKMLDEYWAANK